MSTKRGKGTKLAKPKRPGKTELIGRARLAGLLLETLLSQEQGTFSAAARTKIAEAAKLLADASKTLARSGTGANRPKPKRPGAHKTR